MPTLPTTKVQLLKNAKLGSLVSLRDPNGQVIFGLRIAIAGEREDPKQSAVVRLRSRLEGGGFDAELLPHFANAGWVVSGDTVVLVHSNDWSIHVLAKDWDCNLVFRNFSSEHSGLLLLDHDGQYGLAVGAGAGGCQYLSLKTWLAAEPSAGVGADGKFVAARLWNLSLPGVSSNVEWPLVDTRSGGKRLTL